MKKMVWRFEYGLRGKKGNENFSLAGWTKPEQTTRGILKKLRAQQPSKEFRSRTQLVQGQKIRFIESRRKE